jgi:hypothetical protein
VLQLSDGQAIDINVNRHGYFKISPVPAMPFRLRCRLSNNRIVSTVLITL